MTTPSGIQSGVGFRHCQIFALDGDGYPLVETSGSVPYAGITISGGKTLTLNDPEPRQIVHVGDDRPIALDTLPPTEPVSGELQTAKANFIVDALLSNTDVITRGEVKFMGAGTDQRGNEAQVAMVAYRQSLDTDPASSNFGKRLWDSRFMPKAQVITRENSFDDNPETRVYTVRPQFVTKHVWGTVFSSASEGYGQAQLLRGISEYKPKIAAWKGDGATTVFALPAGDTALSPTTKTTVWVEGVENVGATKAATTITITPAPALDARIVALYEVA